MNCEKFQSAANLATMQRWEGRVGPLASNVLTLLEGQHYAPTDVPTIMEGSSAGKIFKLLGGGGEQAEVVAHLAKQFIPV